MRNIDLSFEYYPNHEQGQAPPEGDLHKEDLAAWESILRGF